MGLFECGFAQQPREDGNDQDQTHANELCALGSTLDSARM